MIDLLSPLEPSPEDVLRPSGTLRGDVAALDAAARGVEVWCGPLHGWRPFGAAAGSLSTVIVHGGRGYAGRTWDLGELVFPKRKRDEDEGATEA